MIKTLKNLLKQDKERYSVPRKVQDIIPIQRIWKDGIFQVGNRFSKTYKFSDINYLVASREDKEAMFLAYSDLLNSLDSGATTKITINNRRLNKANFEQSILMPMRGDSRDVYRKEYNQMLIDKATGANGIMQEKYITISVAKKDIEEARTYFSRVGADLISHFAALGSKCTELDADEKLRVLHDFYRQGEEAAFHFDPQDMMKKGHDFKDYIWEADGVISAKQFLETQNVDVICSDMNMGDGTGLELYKQVHLKYPQIGFILLTNDVRFSVQNQADLYNIPLISKSTSDLIARIIEMINA